MNGPGPSPQRCHDDARHAPLDGTARSPTEVSSSSEPIISSDVPQNSQSSDLVVPPIPRERPGDAPATPQSSVRRPSLAEVILNVHKSPQFLSTLSDLVAQGGPPRIRALWQACEDILEDGPQNRAAIVSDIVTSVVRYHKSVPDRVVVTPPPRVAAAIVSQMPASTPGVQQVCRILGIDPLEVTAMPDELKRFTGEVLLTVVREYYPSAIEKSEQHDRLERIMRHAALKHDGSSLGICLFLRDRFEGCRGWTGKEAEADFLWKLRDDLTSLFLKSPLACEGNFKISLMYPREIPHPALDRVPQSLLNAERWILDYPFYLQEAFGSEHASRIVSRRLSLPLSSAAFMYLGSAPEATIRGILDSPSRFDIDSTTLQPLYRALGMRYGDGAESSSGSSLAPARPPRTWVNKDDEIRYQQTQISLAFRYLFERYLNFQLPDSVRQRGFDFIRAVMNEHPHAFALAAPSIGKLGIAFKADILRIVRDEALRTLQSVAESNEENPEIRRKVVVADGFGMSIPELQASAVREFEIALQHTTGEMMQDFEHVAFLSAMRVFCASTPTGESHARDLIRRYPNTLAAGYLARYLFEVRDPDPSVPEIVCQQVVRSDLEPKIWIQYAHAAVGIGVREEIRQKMRELFESRYERAVQLYARWSPRLRASYRMVIGSLYPHRIGEITPMQRYHSRLVHSSLETRIVKGIEKLQGITVLREVFIPWAPAIDGVVISDANPDRPILVLVDGEPYHSVNKKPYHPMNKSWSFRGFDGHSLLAKNILCGAGYPVIRISAQLGEPGMEGALQECILSIVNHLSGTGEPAAERLVVDAPDEYTEIAGKVMFYRPTRSVSDATSAAIDAWSSAQDLSDLQRDGSDELAEGEASL